MSDARHSGGVQTFGCGRAKYQGLPQSAKSIHGNPELALLKQWISIHNADSDKPGISAQPPQAVCSPPECRAVFWPASKAACFTFSQSFELRHRCSFAPRHTPRHLTPSMFFAKCSLIPHFSKPSLLLSRSIPSTKCSLIPPYYRHIPV